MSDESEYRFNMIHNRVKRARVMFNIETNDANFDLRAYSK